MRVCMCLLIYAYGVWECKEHLNFKGQLGRWGQKIEHGSHPGCKPLMQVCQERQTLFSVFFPAASVFFGSPQTDWLINDYRQTDNLHTLSDSGSGWTQSERDGNATPLLCSHSHLRQYKHTEHIHKFLARLAPPVTRQGHSGSPPVRWQKE